MSDPQLLKIAEISDQGLWEELNARCTQKTFMQSWSSKRWREALGRKTYSLGVVKGSELIAGALVVEMPLVKKLNLDWKFLFILHGPLIAQNHLNLKSQIIELMLGHLKMMAQRRKDIIFLRISPAWIETDQDHDLFKASGLIRAPMFIAPEVTWCLRIDVSNEEIMKGMRKTTRYLVKKALENKELVVTTGSSLDDLIPFSDLYEKTAGRHKFQSFSQGYLEKEIKIRGAIDEAVVFTAHYQNRALASAIIVFYQDVAYYHQGASVSDQPKEAPASYLIQWAAIQEAKKRGCRFYNFWGVADREDRRHAYYGLSLFKKGFGGEKINYLPSYDLPLRWPYRLNYVLEKRRRRRRRL